MIIGISVITCSLIYCTMILFLYFSKSHIKNMENKLYSILISISVFGLILELLCCYFTYTNGNSTFDTIMCIMCNRLFIIYLLTWLSLFTFYIFWVTFDNHEQLKNKVKDSKRKYIGVALTIYIALLVLALILPIEYFNDGFYVYSYGPATELLTIFGGLTIFFDIICVLINKKNIRSRQYYPLFVLIALMLIVLTIRNVNPGIILINSTFAFITAFMYFTIENPDMQLIKELYKNKKLNEKSNEDTSKLMFRITSELKRPVKDIITTSNEMKKMQTKEELLNATQYINNYGNQLDYQIDKVLNISSMETTKLKIYENRYNVHNAFKEIAARASEEIQEPIKFNYQFGESIPTYLYGDSIKLKQAITSVLRIAKNFTEKGFINLDVNSIIRYNFCRLIITIEDSGKGISIDRINEILSVNDDKTNETNIDRIEETNLDIIAVKKIINILGGTFMIKSEEGVGTTVIITLDQKIFETPETEITKRLENYEQTLYSNKKALVIDANEEELKNITNELQQEEIEVTTSILGIDAIQKTIAKNKYDFIILDDEMPNYSAINVIQELQKIEGFKTPVIVMINDNKEGIKLQYLKDGFADCIMKSKLESEVRRIIKRFK